MSMQSINRKWMTLGNISRPSLSCVYHPLITDPKVAFTGDTHQAKGNNDWMITVSEFKKSLNELYKNNYIIVNPHDVYDLSSHHVKAKKIKLPKGKKPLIISIDDMNYYST